MVCRLGATKERARSEDEHGLIAVLEDWKALAGTRKYYPWTGQTLREAFRRTLFLDRAVYADASAPINYLDMRRLPSQLNGYNAQERDLPVPLRGCFPPESKDDVRRLLRYMMQ